MRQAALSVPQRRRLPAAGQRGLSVPAGVHRLAVRAALSGRLLRPGLRQGLRLRRRRVRGLQSRQWHLRRRLRPGQE
uniref:Uncharacterized protein n=1 Tax=Macrostomum lignano TaxID=282301 RepID=A0A1I8IDA4_9PLAT